MQRLFLIIVACLALLVAGCGDDSETTTGSDTTAQEQPKESAFEKEQKAEEKAAEKAAAELPDVTVPKGPPPKKLVVEDLKQGSGKTAKAGDQVSVSYVGVLYKGGDLFDASWGKGSEPFSFKLGAQEVIKGWDQGIQGMKVGGERKLIIPPSLAYGPEAIFPSIPAYSTLVFLVELQGVK